MNPLHRTWHLLLCLFVLHVHAQSVDTTGPFRGPEMWNGVWAIEYPTTGSPQKGNLWDVYYRFEWKQLEADNGGYIWTTFDQLARFAIDNRLRFNFGVMPYYSGASTATMVNSALLSYPLYLHKQMQAETVKDWKNKSEVAWTPDWNSNSFLTSWENLQKAIASHIATTSYKPSWSATAIPYSVIIGYIDIRGFGNFGEWHTAPWGQESGYLTRTITYTSAKRLIDANLKAFPSYWQNICIAAFGNNSASSIWNIQDPAVGYYSLTARTNKGLLGWRRDNWGWNQPWYTANLEGNTIVQNGLVFADEAMNRWKYAPIVGEPISCCTADNGNANDYYYDLLREVNAYHATSIGNGNLDHASDPLTISRFREAGSLMGYKLQVANDNVTGTVAADNAITIYSSWTNRGLTPNYEDWNVKYQLRDASNTIVWESASAMNLKSLLPSTVQVSDNYILPSTLPLGTLSLYVKVTDPTGYRLPLMLRQSGMTSDTAFLLSGPGGGTTQTDPIITNVSALPDVSGTARISWTTSTASDSRVDYGTSSSALSLSSSDANLVTSHVITLTGLTQGATYYYAVTSTDASNNSNTTISSPSSFTVPVPITATCGLDDTNTNFNAGNLGTTLSSVLDSNGALILKPAYIEEFTGSSTPAGWTTATWNNSGTTTYGGTMTMNGTHSYTTTYYPSKTSVEFYAKFSSANNQGAGFSSSATLGAPWVVIGRGTGNASGGLYARSSSGLNVLIATNLLDTYHRYKINWNASNFTIWVDGVLVTTLNFTVSTAMNLHFSDNNNTASATLSLDWLRVLPYQTSGIFTSRVMDAGSGMNWKNAFWNAIQPAGTSISISYRTGNSIAPDGTWTAWTPISNGGALSGNTRYIQYQATLSTSDQTSTPVLKNISFTCSATAKALHIKSEPMVDVTTAPSVLSFDLAQNHPNPFMGRTAIQYSIPRATRVRITVWDIYGRMVKLAEEADRAPGIYTLQLDLHGLAKGIYLYRMQAGDFTKVRKMVVD